MRGMLSVPLWPAVLFVLTTAPNARAQGLPNVIEGFFPTQLVAGQTNVLHLLSLIHI